MATNNLDDLEQLGRCCFDSAQAGRPNPRLRFIKRSFVDRMMSVDLLLQSDVQLLTQIHEEEGKGRTPPQRFHGWYVFPVEVVQINNGKIEPDPTLNNPWHANVISPDISEDPDALEHFYGKIAANSFWQERSFGPALEEFLERVSRELNS